MIIEIIIAIVVISELIAVYSIQDSRKESSHK
jgi:hypothetical protein